VAQAQPQRLDLERLLKFFRIASTFWPLRLGLRHSRRPQKLD